MRINTLLAGMAVATVVGCGLFSCQKQNSFYKVQNGTFTNGNSTRYFVGTNFWYGSILASNYAGAGDKERLGAELDLLKSLGLTNLRILVGADGKNGVPSKIEPCLQAEPGVYEQSLLEGLDYLLVEMGKRDMSAVLYLNNAWEWSGGYGAYLEWATGEKAPNPAEIGYPAYMNAASGFITNEKAKSLFAAHVYNIVSRVNSLTGKAYKDDPTIFSWQISNEPRCFSNEPAVQGAFVEWIWETAAQIKAIDPNHMVSTGSEGAWGCEGSYELFEKVHSCPAIDYITIHIWPYNWSWAKADDLEGTLQNAIAKTDEYIDSHLEIARRYGKPVIIEEFGFPRDGFQIEKTSGTECRNAYYKHIFDRVIESQKRNDVLAGANFWGWGGLAKQTHANWQKGDDYCGDPAQEAQGLNSVYASDESTLELIKHTNKILTKSN